MPARQGALLAIQSLSSSAQNPSSSGISLPRGALIVLAPLQASTSTPMNRSDRTKVRRRVLACARCRKRKLSVPSQSSRASEHHAL